MDHTAKRTIVGVIGNRDNATFKRLHEKVKHLKDCIFYIDNWDVFSKILPKERHIIWKQYTTAIEQDNSNTQYSIRYFLSKISFIQFILYYLFIQHFY